MLQHIRNILSHREQDGASAVEYGLLVAGIAALIVAVVFLFGGMISDVLLITLRRSTPATSAPPRKAMRMVTSRP